MLEISSDERAGLSPFRLAALNPCEFVDIFPNAPDLPQASEEDFPYPTASVSGQRSSTSIRTLEPTPKRAPAWKGGKKSWCAAAYNVDRGQRELGRPDGNA
jgi:hypothetical protein